MPNNRSHPWRAQAKPVEVTRRRQRQWLEQNGADPHLQTSEVDEEERTRSTAHFITTMNNETLDDPFEALRDPYEQDD